MCSLRSTRPAVLALGLALTPALDSHSANLTTTNEVGANTGWNTANIWKTNGTGAATTGVFPGNTYACVFNGIAFGDSAHNTRLRNLYASTSPMLQTFPGDSLTLNPDTEFRFKRISSTAIPTVNFPGVGGAAGLILNGGVLNTGDDGTFSITGIIRVDAQSYIANGNNGGGTLTTARRFNIGAQLTGTGTMTIFQCATNLAEEFSGNSNTFSGQWIVKCGWLLGSGTNSLGTNSITLDPAYVVPLTGTFAAVNNQAVLEVNYDLNSAGTLTLINGGLMRLHQNCVFSAVNIEGTLLSPGTHYYAELAASFPNNFAAGGSGSITVQPYGPPPLLITAQPVAQTLYAGRTAHFNAAVSGIPPYTFEWLRNGSPLSDGGNISGSTSLSLTVSNVAAGDVASYSLRVGDAASRQTTSSAASLALATPVDVVETAVVAAAPADYYRLNETGNPTLGNVLALDFGGGLNGTYGTALLNGFNGINGPQAADGFAGFAAGNKAAQFFNLVAGSRVQVTPWNLNTNTVTLTAWINPTTVQNPSVGLVTCRGGGTVAGLNYSASLDINYNASLGYMWNNEWETYSWNTGLTPPPGQWSYVALVVTPTNATIHMMNTNGLASATHAYPHVVQSFAGTTLIGDDSFSATGARTFNGMMDDVAVFNRALSKADLLAIYSAAAGAVNYAPLLGTQPTNQNLYVGQTAQFAVSGGGSDALTYRWQVSPLGMNTFTDLAEGGKFSGVTTPVLTISPLANADTADYRVVLTNPYGTTNSSTASLYVQATQAAENITMSVQQAANNDWDTSTDWSDYLPASLSAAFKPGSTYEILAGARLRTPQNPRTAIFPGDKLTLDGDATRNVNPPTNATISEIRFKQPNPGTVIFKKLVMNGGQLDCGNDGVVAIGGEINVLTNAPFNNDSGNDRGYEVDAQLTGGGSIEYWGYNQATFRPNYTNNLNIAGTNNTFTGKWNVVIGTLLATAPGALGTNDITVGTNGAFQATYDLDNTNASLFLNGRMYLHRNHTFNTAFVNGLALAAGTHSFAELNAAYPTNFPATWPAQNGAAAFTTGSGSLTVLVTPIPTIVQPPASLTLYPTETAQFTVAVAGTPPFNYQWRKGGTNLTDAGNLFGATTTNLTLTNIVAANAGDYDVIVTNAVGAVTSVVATLTVLPTGPALDLTLDYGGTPIQQAQGLDWNTLTNWSDGRAASVSALANPGSTYHVVAGARLRSPDAAAYSAFPGEVLRVEGDSVWNVNTGAGATIGEIRFKQANPGTVLFKRLVMAGGQFDLGNDGLVIISGRIDIATNTPFSNNNTADRGYRIDAQLTGNGTIEYHGYNQTTFQPGYGNSLNIAGTNNTYSGKWNVVMGALLGTAPGALGTNDITVGTEGALETTYDLYNPQATLTLDGRMFLHQNVTFGAALIGGTPLAPGVYTFAQLNTNFPANFPATWSQLNGSPANAGAGTLTVGVTQPPRVTLGFEFSQGSLNLTWSQGALLEADEVTGPWRTNTTARSPFPVSLTEARKFYRIQVQ